MKVAIVHNMFWRMRGAERAVNEILKIYPDADLYALFGWKDCKLEQEFPPEIALKEINYSWLQKLPFISDIYRTTNIFWPSAVEAWDLTDYDLVISSSSTTTKGVITGISTTHVSYIYTPMRYIWDQQDLYLKGRSVITRGLFKIGANYLRIWDVTSNGRIDRMISISDFVSKRIRKYYDLKPDAKVYPPVDVKALEIYRGAEKKKQLLMVSPFQENKGAQIAIEYAIKENENLILVGTGPEKKNLHRKYANYENIIFTGWVSDQELYEKMAESEAVLFLGVEDFGLVPIEAATLGTPVLALGKGGALESVKGGISGFFIEESNFESIKNGLKEIRKERWDQEAMYNFAKQFSTENFRKNFKEEIEIAIKIKDQKK